MREFLADFARFAGRRGVVAAGLVTAGALLEGIGLTLIVPLLALVIGGGAGHGKLQGIAAAAFHVVHVETPTGRLAALLGLFAVAMILRGIVVSARDVMISGFQLEFVENYRLKITELLATTSWDKVSKLRHARITHLMSGDIQRIGTATHFLLNSTVSTAILIVQCFLAFLLSPTLALLAFALLITTLLALLPIIRRARKLGAYVTQANLLLLNSTSQFLGGLKLAISQNLQSEFVGEFADTQRKLRMRQTAYVREQTFSRVALTTLSAIVGAALVLAGYGLLHVNAPVLITLLLIVGRMSGPAGQIQQGAQQLAHALPAYEAVRELERELAEYAVSAHVARVALPARGVITFDRVSFQHLSGDVGEHGVLDVNLRIEPGEFIGIAGPSGAGKTTFADLLVGLYPPQKGRIAVGGVALDASTIDSWRAGIAYVSQDPFLFHDTVRRNLAWADSKATEEEMWRALALTRVDDVVRRMDQGLDTVVGERGVLMSGGERQRIALARAVLRRPKLLVLDEATNAIDIVMENNILPRLRSLPGRPTIIMIAHRTESLGHCDRLLAMEAGRLKVVS